MHRPICGTRQPSPASMTFRTATSSRPLCGRRAPSKTTVAIRRRTCCKKRGTWTIQQVIADDGTAKQIRIYHIHICKRLCAPGERALDEVATAAAVWSSCDTHTQSHTHANTRSDTAAPHALTLAGASNYARNGCAPAPAYISVCAVEPPWGLATCATRARPLPAHPDRGGDGCDESSGGCNANY